LRQLEVVLADQAGVVPLALQRDSFFARHQRVARDLQFGIESQQREVWVGDCAASTVRTASVL
jgi:hypothetical protein